MLKYKYLLKRLLITDEKKCRMRGGKKETGRAASGGQEAGRLTFIQCAQWISNMASSVCVWQMAGGRVC